MREQSVKIKLNVLKENVKGKRIIMVDDSIVRGTTSANIVTMLRNAGATEVHVRISSPPFKFPCYFGTDIPSGDQLIANHHTIDEIRQLLGADSLGYLDCDRMTLNIATPVSQETILWTLRRETSAETWKFRGLSHNNKVECGIERHHNGIQKKQFSTGRSRCQRLQRYIKC